MTRTWLIGFIWAGMGMGMGQTIPPPTSPIEGIPISTYRWSLVALTTAHTLDIQSSWGGRELNPILRSGDGRFGARGAGVKSGIVMGAMITQYMVLRKFPRRHKVWKVATVVNWVGAGWIGGVAVRNWRVR